MRPATPARPPRRAPVLAAAVLLVMLLAMLTAAPAAAKEGLTVRFDAPIAMDTPPGTELLVGITVTVITDDGEMPVEGSPVYLQLTGRDGAVTRAAGEGGRPAGHYTMRITVPAGGARGAEVGIHGTSDLPMMLANDPFTFGAVRAGTAQVAPPLAPPITPWPRASAGVAPAPAGLAPVPEPAGPAGPTLGGTLGVVALASLAGLALLAGLRRARTSRLATGRRVPDERHAGDRATGA